MATLIYHNTQHPLLYEKESASDLEYGFNSGPPTESVLEFVGLLIVPAQSDTLFLFRNNADNITSAGFKRYDGSFQNVEAGCVNFSAGPIGNAFEKALSS